MEFKQRNIKFLFPVFALIFLAVYVFTASLMQLKSYNVMNKLTMGSKKPSDEIKLVVIDDKSLIEIGRWPWKREYYLEIFDYFENYTNAKLVGYDGLIMVPDLEHPESDKKFFSGINNFRKLVMGVVFSDEEFKKDVNEEYYNNLLKTKIGIKITDKRTKPQQKSRYKSFTALQKDFFENVILLGGLNIIEDKDGYARKVSQVTSYKDMLFPSMSLIMHSKYTGNDEYIIEDKYFISKDGTLRIPIENSYGSVLNYICYYNTDDEIYSHEKYSASDIIKSYRAIKSGKKPVVDAKIFDDKIIFVGANAHAQAQAIADINRTPVSETFSGLDIQATNFDNLLTNNFYRVIKPAYNFLICLIIFVLIFILTNMLAITPALISSVSIMGIYFIFTFFMYENKIATDIILPELFVIVALACSYSYKYLLEDNKKTKIQKAMGKYLSQDVMENVVKNIDNISLGGKRADITVLFADIRNFTTISETMDPNSVTDILNEYFSAMVPIIENNNGILNKFMGDAILAIFGEPERENENHALNAVKCACSMIKKVRLLQEKWMDEGKPKIEIGIGISSGEAFIGNIGSQERLEYTVIGDTVNTASRIENYNKIYKTNLLISEGTYERVKENIDVIIIKDVTIKGKANKINLYEVIRLID